MPVGDDEISTDGQASSQLDHSLLAVTNYGSQIKFNYGTISNYFCKHDHDAQHSAIPSSAASLPSQLHTKLQTGCALYKSERYIEAKVLFDEVLQDPNLKDDAVNTVKYDLARVHYALSEYTQAARLFRDVTSYQEQGNLEEDNIDASIHNSRFWLACCLFRLEEFDEASCQFRIIVMTDDERLDTQQVTRARLWLGLTFERLGQYESAREYLEIAHSTLVCDTEFGPEHLDTLACRHHLANFLYKQKAYLKALQHYEDLLLVEGRMSGPEKAEAIKTRCMMVLCLGQLRRWREAEPQLRLVVSRMETDPSLGLKELEDVGLLYLWLGYIIWTRGDLRYVDEANSMLRCALKHLHVNKNLKKELAECQLGLAEIMNLQDQFSLAEHTIREALPILETSSVVNVFPWHYALAVALYHQTKIPEALLALESIIHMGENKETETTSDLIKDSPQHPRGEVDRLQLLCTLHTDRGHLRHIATRSGGRLDCLELLGVIYTKLGHLDKAHHYFQQVVQKTPMLSHGLSIISRVCLGSISSGLQDFQSARTHLQDAQQLKANYRTHGTEPRDPMIDAMLGRTLCALQLFDEAELYLRPIIAVCRDYEKGRVIQGIIGHVYYCTGRCAIHRKDFPGARDYLERASPMIGRSFGLDGHLYLECRYRLAYCFRAMRRNCRAKTIFEELLHSNSQDPAAHEFCSILAPFWLGYIYCKQRRSKDAERLSRKALAEWGDTPSYQGIRREEAVFALALALLCSKKKEETEECRLLIEQVVKNDSIEAEMDRATFLGNHGSWFVATRRLLAESNYRTKRFEEAYNMFNISIPRVEMFRGYDHEESALDRAHQADCLSELGRFEEAELLVNNAATQNVMNGDNVSWRIEIKTIGVFWLGCQAFRDGELRTAHSYFTEVQRLWPPKGQSSRRFWDFRSFDSRYHLACIDRRNGKGKKVEASFRELLRQQHDAGYLEGAADSCWILAGILRSHKCPADLQEAKSLYSQIIENERDGKFERGLVHRSHSSLGHCLFAEGNYQEAKNHFEQVIDSPIERFEDYFLKGMTLYHLKMYEDAASWFTRINTSEKCPPNTVEALDCLYWAGRSYAAIGNWPEARVKFQHAHSSKKQGVDWDSAAMCLYHLGRVLFAEQKYIEAWKHFDFLRGKPPNLSVMPGECAYYSACCQLELRQPGAAEKTFSDCPDLWPQTHTAQIDTEDTAEELFIMCVKFQFLRCVCRQAKLPDLPLLDSVLSFFERWCPAGVSKETHKVDWGLTIELIEFELGQIANFCHRWGQAIVFLKMALAKNEGKSRQQSHGARILPLLECKSELGVALVGLGKYEEAIFPLCEVLKARKDAAHVTGDSSATSSQQVFDHEVKIIEAKLQLCGAAHGAKHTAEAEKLAQEVLMWSERHNEGWPQEQQVRTPTELIDEKITEEQKKAYPVGGESNQNHHIARRHGLAAEILLARIAHEAHEDYAQAASHCAKAFDLLSGLKGDLPLENFDYDEIRLHFYMARTLAKVPDRNDEDVARAIKALELEKTKKTATVDLVTASTEGSIYFELLKEEFGGPIDAYRNK